jgi:Alginate lyase
MTNNGTTNASWSSGSGTHTMEIDEAITHLPVVKPHIVAGQIHDASDDVIVFRLEGQKLFIDINGTDGPTLNSAYVLGTRFKVKFVVSGNQTKCYYNDVLKYTLSKSYSGAYFKAGAYTQSSCKSGGTPGPSESCSAYGEVLIYNVTVTHQ